MMQGPARKDVNRVLLQGIAYDRLHHNPDLELTPNQKRVVLAVIAVAVLLLLGRAIL